MNTNREFYFLRSFEQHIVTQLVYFAARLDESGENLESTPDLNKYHHYFGLTSKDVGVYAMIDHKVAGGAWVRLLKGDAKGQNRGFAYIDEQTPELVFGMLPEYRNQGIGTELMQQLFEEAARSYDQISLAVRESNPAIALYERLGFVKVESKELEHPRTQEKVFVMLKKLTKPVQELQGKGWFEETQKWRMPS